MPTTDSDSVVNVVLPRSDWSTVLTMLDKLAPHDAPAEKLIRKIRQAAEPDPVDEASAESFPASDPPSFTPISRIGA
jgi:hypothetical protein